MAAAPSDIFASLPLFFPTEIGDFLPLPTNSNEVLSVASFVPSVVGDFAFFEDYSPSSETLFVLADLEGRTALSLFVFGSVFWAAGALGSAFLFLDEFNTNLNSEDISVLVSISLSLESNKLETEACSPSESFGLSTNWNRSLDNCRDLVVGFLGSGSRAPLDFLEADFEEEELVVYF